MDRLYQVFVSSTFEDLKNERQAVSNALAKAGFIVAGMELFPAADQQQLAYIERVIDRSDYYVVIIGGRYGSLAENGYSYTENEYRYAKSKGIPVLAFIHSDPQSIALGKTDPENAEKLTAFRETLQKGRIAERWLSGADLCTNVVIALTSETTLRPGVGWVRGDQAVDPKVLQDLERLRLENRELRERIGMCFGVPVEFDPRLHGPEDPIKVEILVSVGKPGQSKFHSMITQTSTLSDLFLNLHESLIKETNESAIKHEIVDHFVRNIREEGKQYSVSSEDSIKAIRNLLVAHDLIKTSTRSAMRHTGNRQYEGREFIWQITEKGERYFAERSLLSKNRVE